MTDWPASFWITFLGAACYLAAWEFAHQRPRAGASLGIGGDVGGAREEAMHLLLGDQRSVGVDMPGG